MAAAWTRLCTAPVPVSLDSDGLTGDDGANGEGDTIQADVENLEGGKAADHVFGSGVSNYLKGNAGDDQVRLSRRLVWRR